jgi:phosphoribosylamine---glycine ligase
LVRLSQNIKILVVGAGGREHALAWKLAQSPRVAKVFVAPGNAGTALEDGVQNMPLTDARTLIAFAQRERIAFTVIGPEAPLAAGVANLFRDAGLKIFGPSREAAQLESSKDYAKRFMQRYKIPAARSETFNDAHKAHVYIDVHGAPIVIKADGLAAGKGVVVAETTEEAHRAVEMMLLDKKLGEAGARVVIEEFLPGLEASFIVMADGEHVLPLASSQDHKRLLDGDRGPNTGGMGAYSPAPIVTPRVHARVMREIIKPAIKGMLEQGTPYTGFLYAGLMIDAEGNPKALEFNCRLGDPETQPIMMRLKTDLSLLLEHALAGKLDQVEAQWDRRVALGVVLAAEGYPDAPRKGDTISGLPKPGHDCHIFHAGTATKDSNIVTNGGRVLCVTALGDNLRMARQLAYAAAHQIRFEGRQMRGDIGERAVSTNKV